MPNLNVLVELPKYTTASPSSRSHNILPPLMFSLVQFHSSIRLLYSTAVAWSHMWDSFLQGLSSIDCTSTETSRVLKPKLPLKVNSFSAFMDSFPDEKMVMASTAGALQRWKSKAGRLWDWLDHPAAQYWHTISWRSILRSTITFQFLWGLKSSYHYTKHTLVRIRF